MPPRAPDRRKGLDLKAFIGNGQLFCCLGPTVAGQKPNFGFKKGDFSKFADCKGGHAQAPNPSLDLMSIHTVLSCWDG